jgi:membrane-bound transcription factor site-1 protease
MHQRLSDFGGYHFEVLTDPFTCFDAKNYGALMIVDPEDYFSIDEISKLRQDVEQEGLSLIVIGDWYNEAIMQKASFMNNNTFERWEPVMAGANVGSINALLQPYKIALGDKRVMTGDFVIDKR